MSKSKVGSKKLWYNTKHTLYKKFSEEKIDAGLLIAQDNPAPDKSNGQKQFSLFCSAKHFQEYQKTQKMRNFYEIIPGGKPQKLKFDFDGATDLSKAESDFLLVLKAIKKVFKFCFGVTLSDSNLAICTSHAEDKRSWHIIIDKYYVANHEQAKAFYELVWREAPQTLTATGSRCLDQNVYSSWQPFRLLGSTKKNKPRVKILDKSCNFDFEQLLITNIESCELIEIPLASARKLTSPPLETAAEKKTVSEVRCILERLKPERWQSCDSWIKIGMAFKSELGSTGLPLWKYYSEQTYEEYNELMHNKTWKSFQKDGIGMGTLIHWALEDTEQETSKAIEDFLSFVEEWEYALEADDDSTNPLIAKIFALKKKRKEGVCLPMKRSRGSYAAGRTPAVVKEYRAQLAAAGPTPTCTWSPSVWKMKDSTRPSCSRTIQPLTPTGHARQRCKSGSMKWALNATE